jgi:hypothetical protein
MSGQATFDNVMLILRGVANAENPNGQLDDQSALEYARRVGFRGASKKASSQKIAAKTAASRASRFVRKVAAAIANATPIPKHGTAEIAQMSRITR